MLIFLLPKGSWAVTHCLMKNPALLIAPDLVCAKLYSEDRLQAASHLSFGETQHFPGLQQTLLPPAFLLPQAVSFTALFSAHYSKHFPFGV